MQYQTRKKCTVAMSLRTARLGLYRSLGVQDAERLVQGLDLLLPTGHALLVRHAGVDAGRAELFQLLERLVQEGLLLAHVRQRVRDFGDRRSLLCLGLLLP